MSKHPEAMKMRPNLDVVSDRKKSGTPQQKESIKIQFPLEKTLIIGKKASRLILPRGESPKEIALSSTIDVRKVDISRLTPRKRGKDKNYYTIEEMRAIARGMGIDHSGSKESLYTRIIKSLEGEEKTEK